MSRGIEAMWIMIAVVLAISFMGAVGAYNSISATAYNTTGQADVNRIVQVMEEPKGSITGVAAIDPIISMINGGLDIIQIGWIIISDTSELFLLLGAPEALADVLETIARISFGLTIVYVLIRQRLS